jgi:hypothetical protein
LDLRQREVQHDLCSDGAEEEGRSMKKQKTPAVLDRIVDRVLAYNPKAKKKKPRKQKKTKKRETL